MLAIIVFVFVHTLAYTEGQNMVVSGAAPFGTGHMSICSYWKCSYVCVVNVVRNSELHSKGVFINIVKSCKMYSYFIWLHCSY